MFNLTNYLKKAPVNIEGKQQYSYTIGTGLSPTDLQRDLNEPFKRNFTATYSCGSNPLEKIINVDQPARGKTTQFDCSTLNKTCGSARLTLEDTGDLILTDGDGKKVWTKKTPNMPTQPVLGAVYPHTAAKGKFKVNYLVSGNELQVGEFLGSPQGYCYLLMTAAGLQMCYDTPGCAASDTSTNGVKLFQIKDKLPKAGTLGKSGFIDDAGKLHEYPNAMLTTLGLDFLPVGAFDAPGAAAVKPAFKSTSRAECQKSCATENTCAGFVFNKDSKDCALKTSSMYPKGPRILKPGSEMFVRTKGLKNHASCNKHMQGSTAKAWEALPLDAKNKMSSTTLCNLGVVTKTGQDAVDKKEKLLKEVMEEAEPGWNPDLGLFTELKRQARRLHKVIREVTGASADAGASADDTVNGLFEHAKLVRQSEKIKTFVWLFLALVLILAIVRRLTANETTN